MKRNRKLDNEFVEYISNEIYRLTDIKVDIIIDEISLSDIQIKVSVGSKKFTIFWSDGNKISISFYNDWPLFSLKNPEHKELLYIASTIANNDRFIDKMTEKFAIFHYEYLKIMKVC